MEEILFATSRILLVTKGLEPKSEQDVYALFKEHFVQAGLVDNRFEELVDLAYHKQLQDLVSREDEVLALAEAVVDLYRNMDDSLQIKPVEPKQSSVSGTPQVEHVKDLRGVLCPMNFVKTKLALASLQSGDLLEIWLDDGKPIENVPGSVLLEGHSIVQQKQTQEGYWKVVICKK